MRIAILMDKSQEKMISQNDKIDVQEIEITHLKEEVLGIKGELQLSQVRSKAA